MEKILNKIKTLNLLLVILSLTSIAWLIIDYFVLKGIYNETDFTLTFSWVLIFISSFPFLLTFITSLILSYYIARLKLKFNSDQRKTVMKKTEKKIIDK